MPLVFLFLVLAGCTVGDESSPQCRALAKVLASCGADPAIAAVCDVSDPEEIQAAIQKSCSELLPVTNPGGFELTGLAEGEWCVLSEQCEPGLVCRSALSFENLCLPPGQLGEHCWVSSHCADGLSCHWIGAHDIPGTLLHPGRVCNPHDDNAEHPHQLDGT